MAEGTALLFRNGTAFMVSPNHKTAADAIRTTPQKAENSRHDDGGDETVEPIHNPPWPGMIWLDP